MRTELKIGLTVLLVLSVMVLVYFVFFTTDQQKANKPKEDVGSINRSPSPEANHSPAPRIASGSRSGRLGRGGEPIAMAPATTPTPSPSPTAAPMTITPATLVPPSGTGSSDVESHPLRGPGDAPTATPRPDRPGDSVIPPVPMSMMPTPSPSPMAVPTPRAAPGGMSISPTPTPGAIYMSSPPPRITTITPAPVDDRPTLAPVHPGAADGNAASAPRTGLVRKADGKDYYVVQKDDKGLWGIAAKPFVYGDGSKWDVIAKANPNADSSSLHAGQELLVPPLPHGATTHPAVLSTTRPAGTHGGYVIKAGDTLDSIAKSQYGDGSLWKEIAKANPDLDPAKLHIGKEIVIPAVAGRSPAPSPAASPAPSPAPGVGVTRPSATPRPAASPTPTPSDRAAPVRSTPPPTPPGFD